jgi:hypothetical protein
MCHLKRSYSISNEMWPSRPQKFKLRKYEEFPEFSKKEISNPLMFQHNFESGGGTLISLRSLALALTL